MVVDFDVLASRAILHAALKRLRGRHRVTVCRFRDRRSDRQNRYWHPAFVEPFREAMHEQGEDMDHDTAHYALAEIAVGKTWHDRKTGKTIRYMEKTSSEMDTAEFNYMLDMAAKFLAETFGIPIPDPSEYHEKDTTPDVPAAPPPGKR